MVRYLPRRGVSFDDEVDENWQQVIRRQCNYAHNIDGDVKDIHDMQFVLL